MDRNTVKLNFLPIKEQDLSFKVYRKSIGDNEQTPEIFKEYSRFRLPTDENPETYGSFLVSFSEVGDFAEYECTSNMNHHLTCRFLFTALVKSCQDSISAENYDIREHKFERRVYLFIKHHGEIGNESVWLEPYYLRRRKMFGYLCDFRFLRNQDYQLDRYILQLSLSLDKNFRDNRNYYVDRYGKISNFIRHIHNKERPFPIVIDDKDINISENLLELHPRRLDKKIYEFNQGKSSSSQFMGMKKYGPLKMAEGEPLICFVYRSQDKPLSHDLYRALDGQTYPTFPGMLDMFGYRMSGENVIGIEISDFAEVEIKRAINKMKQESGDRPLVPVVLIPWDRHDDFAQDLDQNIDEAYYKIKYLFLMESLPSQFISLNTIQNRNKLKWSISNIGLGVFAKMGGTPWKVRPQNKNCLIIGIGQSHSKNEENEIKKFFAYSVLTDSSGLFEDILVLSKQQTEDEYIEDIIQNLCNTISLYSDRYDKFCIHTTFKINKKEIRAIKQAIDSSVKKYGDKKEFVILKFNQHNKFFGYSNYTNSMVPFESEYVYLSDKEYILWFEGVQDHNAKLQKKIGRPMHVTLLYPRDHLGFSHSKMVDYLQDSLNLSGANWRGFNAKSLPVSVYYARLLAKFFNNFNKLGLEDIPLDRITPWFL